MNQEQKRAAIVGTAPSWVETPWDDPGLTICTLNDGYSLGVGRISEHYDLHPFSKMWFRPKTKRIFKEGDIPDGVYVRPEGHIEWLKDTAKTVPVWLQDTPPSGWPVNAKRFPIEDVKALLKSRPDQESYIASSPALMLAHLIVRGFTEIQIYGIHLATQGEYIKQRPQFEYLLGKAEAMGITIILPKSCPLLKHTHVYGYEPEPQRPDLPYVKRMQKAQQELSTLTVKVAEWPRWKSKATALARMARLRAEIRDAQLLARHAVMAAGDMGA